MARPGCSTSFRAAPGAVVRDWLAGRETQWCAGAQVAALDPLGGYDTALPATPFHAIKLGQNTIDAVRRRVQQDTLGYWSRQEHIGDRPEVGAPTAAQCARRPRTLQ